jgi:hypothetical protein
MGIKGFQTFTSPSDVLQDAVGDATMVKILFSNFCFSSYSSVENPPIITSECLVILQLLFPKSVYSPIHLAFMRMREQDETEKEEEEVVQ